MAMTELKGRMMSQMTLKSSASLGDARDDTRAHINSLLSEEPNLSVADAKKLKHRQYLKTFWTQGTEFQAVVGLVIIANAVTLGLEVDYAETWKKAFGFLDHIFTVIFLIEMGIRWRVEGLRTYFSDAQSMIDFSVALLGVIVVWIIQPFLQGESSAVSDLRTISMLRLLRLVRLARLIRVFSVFKELAIIAQSFAAGGKTLMWGGVFVGIVVYVFGIFAVDFFGRASNCEAQDARMLKPKARTGGEDEGGSQGFESECQDVYDFGSKSQYTLFGSLDRAMLTLYMCVTDGCGSDIVYEMVLKTPWVMVYWYLFVFITSFGLVNVMVGLFCENVFTKALENEKEAAAVNCEKRIQTLNTLAKIFKEMDQDGSRTISRVEFMTAVQNNETVEKCLEELDLDDNVHLFDVLDVDAGGVLTLKEFFSGALLFTNGNEPCKVKDTVGTYLLTKAIFKRLTEISEYLGLGATSDSLDDFKATDGFSPDSMNNQNSRIDSLDSMGSHEGGAPAASSASPSPKRQCKPQNLPDGDLSNPNENIHTVKSIGSQLETLQEMMTNMNEQIGTISRRMNDMEHKVDTLYSSATLTLDAPRKPLFQQPVPSRGICCTPRPEASGT